MLSGDYDDMIKYTKVMGSLTGIFPAPEGASCLAAQVHLLEQGWIQPDEKVLLLLLGSIMHIVNDGELTIGFSILGFSIL